MLFTIEERWLEPKLTEKKVKIIVATITRAGFFTRLGATLKTMLDISAGVWVEKDPNITIEAARAWLKKKMSTI